MPAYERNHSAGVLSLGSCGSPQLVLHVNVSVVHTAGVSSGRMILIILKSFMSAVAVLTHVSTFFLHCCRQTANQGNSCNTSMHLWFVRLCHPFSWFLTKCLFAFCIYCCAHKRIWQCELWSIECQTIRKLCRFAQPNVNQPVFFWPLS